MATNNSANNSYTNNADGFSLAGGTTPRTLTLTAGNVTLSSGGSNTYTMPAATGTLVSRDSTDTLTNKDLTSSTNTFPTGMAVQQVSTLSTAVATGTTLIPFDDTIPQSGEGTEFMTCTITPKSTTNILIIQVVVFGSNSNANGIIAALFQDSTANALAADATYQATATGTATIPLTYTMAAGTTSATTFKVRAGSQNAGTFTFNGSAGGRIFGAITKSSIVITEYKA